jgi:hypothetical protein
MHVFPVFLGVPPLISSTIRLIDARRAGRIVRLLGALPGATRGRAQWRHGATITFPIDYFAGNLVVHALVDDLARVALERGVGVG